MSAGEKIEWMVCTDVKEFEVQPVQPMSPVFCIANGCAIQDVRISMFANEPVTTLIKYNAHECFKQITKPTLVQIGEVCGIAVPKSSSFFEVLKLLVEWALPEIFPVELAKIFHKRLKKRDEGDVKLMSNSDVIKLLSEQDAAEATKFFVAEEDKVSVEKEFPRAPATIQKDSPKSGNQTCLFLQGQRTGVGLQKNCDG